MISCRCAIIEDEPLAQKIIVNYIRKHKDLELVGVYSSALKALEGLRTNKPDLLFLDINLPILNGLDFISSIKEAPAVIFTTADPEYAVASYNIDAIDYLLKPITFERFSSSVAKYFKKAKTSSDNQSSGFFFVKEGTMFKKICIADVIWIEALKDYLRIHLEGGSVITHMTMKTMEEKLQDLNFIRIHRSYLVPLQAIESISTESVRLSTTELPIGDKYKSSVIATVRNAFNSRK